MMATEMILAYAILTITLTLILSHRLPVRGHFLRSVLRLNRAFWAVHKQFTAKVGRLHQILLVLASIIATCTATTAYDCEANTAKLATVSLEAVGGCEPFNSTYGEEETIQVQVLQRSHQMSLPVYSCQLRISREICTCRYNREPIVGYAPATVLIHTASRLRNLGAYFIIHLASALLFFSIAVSATTTGLIGLLNALRSLFLIADWANHPPQRPAAQFFHAALFALFLVLRQLHDDLLGFSPAWMHRQRPPRGPLLGQILILATPPAA